MGQTTYSRVRIGQLDKQFRTNLINSLTGFKSVALIGTISGHDTTNLAVFSQIIHVGANPPLVGILFRPHTVSRHTLENILHVQSFTINHIRPEFVQQAHHTSARWDRSEFDACELSPEYLEGISAPFVKEATVKLGLTYVEHYTLISNETVFLVGEIQLINLPESCVASDGYIDLVQAGTLTCTGLDAYHEVLPPTRYAYAKPDLPVKRIDD